MSTVLAFLIIVCGIFLMRAWWVSRNTGKSTLTPLPPQTPQPRTQAYPLNRVAPSVRPIGAAIASKTATTAPVQEAPYVVPGRLNLDKEVPRQYVVFDLETTGLTAARHEIIEIGAILVDRDVSTKRIFHTLVKPATRIPTRITEITGISQAMVNESGLPLDCALNEFLTFAVDLPLIAYNASFDMGFLRVAAERCDLPVRNEYACALKMARRAFPTLENHKLSTVSTALKFRCEGQDEGMHRAVGDCRRTVHVYQAAAKTLGLRVL
jgi:DNA polymerase-3 subunit epsilon